MRLTELDANELFSFDTITFPDLPARALVIVGPNGSGKTNISRVIEIVVAAVERWGTFSQEPYSRLVQFAAGRRFEAMAHDVSVVGVGIALTEGWEHDLLVRFVRAAIFTSLFRDAPSNVDTGRVETWLNAIRDEQLAPLARGRITAELNDPATGHWGLAYDFEAGGVRFRWVMEGALAAGALIRVEDAARSVPVYPMTQNLRLDTNGVPVQSFAIADLLPPAGEGRMLSIEAGSLSAKAPVRAWASVAGLPVDDPQRRNYTLAWILRLLFNRALVLLSDVRLPPVIAYATEEAGFDPAPADGSRVPLRLFRLKNGGPADRRRFATIQELFTRLTGMRFDVTLAQEPTSSADMSASLRISPIVDRAGHDLPVEFSGAGIWEALLLSATLADSTGRVVILDEPARNLHPTLQRTLLDELQRAPGQFIVTTHSPYLVPVKNDARTRICRLALHNGATRPRFLSTDAVQHDARIWKVLGESADSRALLFAQGVVLVEGGTELGALPEWFAKSQTAQEHGTPDALNIAFFSVEGDGGFGTFVRYLHGLGVPWVIVCDGGIFRFDTGKTQILEQIVNAGIAADEPRSTATAASRDQLFADARDAGARHGVFTLAQGWETPEEAFETYVETVAPGALSEAARIVGRSKPRQGRYVAAGTACPHEIDDLYSRILRRLGIL